jgi:trehalose 2-sulfotransferase
VAGPLSYLLCGTPRTGSTLLCGLLTATGVAGRPESYFRQPDEPAWARRLGVPVAGDGSFDYRWFVRAVRVAGSTPNGVFAARVMWGTMQRIVDGLDASPPRRDLDVLVDAFGPLRMVHLRRDDVVGQAVSWARAEQTGYWQEGDRSSAQARFDFGQVADLVRTIREHNAAWSTWFAEQGVEPHSVTYEEVTGNPRQAVHEILEHLGIELPTTWRPAARQRRQADALNADWIRRYRAAQRRSSDADGVDGHTGGEELHRWMP